MNDSLELSEKIENMNDDCALEFSGCKVHKYIQLLVLLIKFTKYFLKLSIIPQRMAGDHFDQDGSAVMRIQSDGAPKTSSPHVLAVRVGT